MRIVKKENEAIEKTLNEQCIGQGDTVRFATWCVAVPAIYGDILLFNVLTRELVLMEKDESRFLCLSDLSSSDIQSIQGSVLYDYLYKHWFLVPEIMNDHRLVDEVRAVMACIDVSDGIREYTILTTTDCNARCFYCFEHGMEKVNMTCDTAFDIVEYIKKTAGKKVTLRWFGGEPLFNASVIDLITEELRNAGIDFQSEMVSNGYLVTDSIVNKAIELWNLQRIQITLDGTEEIYNRRKAYVYSVGSAFRRVLENINKLLTAGIIVHVRLNLDMDNVGDLYKLCDLLVERFSSYEKFEVYVYYILEKNSASPRGYSFDDTFGELKKLKGYLNEKGLTRRSKVGGAIKVNQCMADTDSSIVISPTGELFKCLNITDSTKSCGTIYTGVQKQEKIEYWRKPAKNGEICEKCQLYAECIRIAACQSHYEYCSQAVYEDRIDKLKDSVLYTYEQESVGKNSAEEKLENT
ncbi:MAG: radical SAM protein [Clostridiales bacterium]|nr:radical SAM protein [Clostridiales bacterium]